MAKKKATDAPDWEHLILEKIVKAADAGELRDIANTLEQRTDAINAALILRLTELVEQGAC